MTKQDEKLEIKKPSPVKETKSKESNEGTPKSGDDVPAEDPADEDIRPGREKEGNPKKRM